MAMIDNDEAVRDRAYDLWEKAGRPSGLEHVHWAEATRQIEMEAASAAIVVTVPPSGEATPPDRPVEVVRLRNALYAPEPFSFELFGKDCPEVDLAIILRAA